MPRGSELLSPQTLTFWEQPGNAGQEGPELGGQGGSALLSLGKPAPLRPLHPRASQAALHPRRRPRPELTPSHRTPREGLHSALDKETVSLNGEPGRRGGEGHKRRRGFLPPETGSWGDGLARGQGHRCAEAPGEEFGFLQGPARRALNRAACHTRPSSPGGPCLSPHSASRLGAQTLGSALAPRRGTGGAGAHLAAAPEASHSGCPESESSEPGSPTDRGPESDPAVPFLAAWPGQVTVPCVTKPH